MGKKSLIKSTSKKKRTPKKSAAAVNPKEKAPTKKTEPAKPKPSAKSKPVPKTEGKATSKIKPVSVKDLLNKKFDIVTPKVLYTVPNEMVEKSTFTAPEYLSGFKAEDAKRIKGILANTYNENDLKAASEKAATEKAAAEKAAAEKAAAEKAAAIKKTAAQKSDVTVSYEPPSAKAVAKEPSDPVDNSIKLIAAGLAFLVLLVIGASASNSFKYYLAENQGALEIWKGKFAPLGKKMVISLPGTPTPEIQKDVYSADDVYPLVFDYFIDKADARLDVPGIPDFAEIKSTLKTALKYGSTNSIRTVAYERLDNIDRLILTYKADVAASRGTIDDLTAAIDFLEDADKLTTDEAQEALIAQKIAAYGATITALEEETAAEEQTETSPHAEEAAAAESADASPEAPEAAEETPESDTGQH